MPRIRHGLPAVLALAACMGTMQYHRREPRPEDDLDEPAAPPVASDARIPGPLSLTTRYPDTPWPERQQARRDHDARYIGNKIMRDDAAAFLAVADRFYPPRTPRQREAQTVAHREVATLETLTPYSLEHTINGFIGAGERYPLCIRDAHTMWHCDPWFKPPPAAATPFELTEPAPGIVQLAIHDLSNAAATLPIDQLAKARAVVLDLRDAAGADPRPLIPWLEAFTGRPLRPLRAIERPAEADRYVAAYQARYLPESRDPDAWASLVGPAQAAPAHAAKPIAVVVGRYCGAACELVARVLETYAGATVTGGVSRSGRLSRDEPALLELPHTKIDVFFHATHYLLAADIEAATGPSDEWTAVEADPVDFDGTAYALREVTARLAGGWPRCDSFPAYTTVKALPAAVADKLQSALWLDKICTDTAREVNVVTDLPVSALERYLATCAVPLRVTSRWTPYGLAAPDGMAALPVLSQLAQSELVKEIRISCAARNHLDAPVALHIE